MRTDPTNYGRALGDEELEAAAGGSFLDDLGGDLQSAQQWLNPGNCQFIPDDVNGHVPWLADMGKVRLQCDGDMPTADGDW
jgi:hypothetical protein